MTKNKTMKNLTWKLKELPTASEISDLVMAKIITSEEAREIVFGATESDKEKIKALEDLVEFLQDLVKDLSKSRTTLVPFQRTIYYNANPYWDRYWGQTERILCKAGLDISSTTTTGGFADSYAVSNISNLNGDNNVYHTDTGALNGDTVKAVSLSVSYGGSGVDMQHNSGITNLVDNKHNIS